MIKATHEHKSKSFKDFRYLVKGNRVFMLIENQWKHSTMELRNLVPIGTRCDDPVVLKNQPLIAKDVKTSKEILYHSIDEVIEKGFSRAAVNQCLNNERGSHKGFKWRVAS